MCVSGTASPVIVRDLLELHTRRLLLGLAIAGLVWAVAVAWTGGLLVQTPWGRLSSRGPIRPLAIASLAAVAYYVWFGRRWAEDAGRAASIRWPPFIAAACAALALLTGIRLGTFVAGAADPYGYVSQAELWLHGDLIQPTPDWATGAPWTNAEWTTMPLGYVPGPRPHTQVPMYAPGLPMMMALFEAIGGREAVYYVVPILGAVLVWMTYLIGSALAGPWAGAIAGALMVSSPSFLVWLVMPMTDVPIAAWWSMALALALRGKSKSLYAGLATSAAILTRPNLAPLAAIAGLIVLMDTADRGGRAEAARALVSFSAGVFPGVIAVAAINTWLYGSPLRSGYGTLAQIYAIDRVLPNTAHYFGWLAATQTPLVTLALLAPLLAIDRAQRVIVLFVTVLFPLAVVALYLPYLVFDDWLSLRFLLSAYPGLFAGMAVTIVAACGRVPRRPAFAVAALVVAGLTLRGFGYSHTPAEYSRSEIRYKRLAERAAGLPPAAVFLTRNHSGSLRYYGGRDILRWDILEPAELDTAIDYLTRRGHEVYLVVDEDELAMLRQRFMASSAFQQLDAASAMAIDRVLLMPLRPRV